MAEQIYEVRDLSGADSPEFFSTVGKALADVAVKLVEEDMGVEEVRVYMTADDMTEESGADGSGLLFPRFYFHGEFGSGIGYAVVPVTVEGLISTPGLPEDHFAMPLDVFGERVKALRIAKCRCIRDMSKSEYENLCGAIARAEGVK